MTRLGLGELELRLDLYAATDRSGDRTVVGVHRVHALDGLAMRRVGLQVVEDMDPPDDEHFAVLADFAGDIGLQLAAARIDSARLQRAPEGSDQSAAGCGDDVVEGRRVGRHQVGIDAVVLGDL